MGFKRGEGIILTLFIYHNFARHIRMKFLKRLFISHYFYFFAIKQGGKMVFFILFFIAIYYLSNILYFRTAVKN